MALPRGFTAPIVMALGRWKTERMTRRYAAVTDETLRRAAEAVARDTKPATMARERSRGARCRVHNTVRTIVVIFSEIWIFNGLALAPQDSTASTVRARRAGGGGDYGSRKATDRWTPDHRRCHAGGATFGLSRRACRRRDQSRGRRDGRARRAARASAAPVQRRCLRP